MMVSADGGAGNDTLVLPVGVNVNHTGFETVGPPTPTLPTVATWLLGLVLSMLAVLGLRRSQERPAEDEA